MVHSFFFMKFSKFHEYFKNKPKAEIKKRGYSFVY